METNETIKKVLEYNKAIFENTCNSVVAAQQHIEELTGKTLKEAEFVPEESKVFVKKWIELGKKTTENYKQAVTRGQEQLEGYIAAL